jgi:DNA-binding NarL/FixJ family response regulator
MRTTSYEETQAIVAALEFALKKGGFGQESNQKKTAARIIKEMKSASTVSGRQQQIVQALQKGTTIPQMMKAIGASRRTIFRYLNHFEEAGLDIELTGSTYRMK